MSLQHSHLNGFDNSYDHSSVNVIITSSNKNNSFADTHLLNKIHHHEQRKKDFLCVDCSFICHKHLQWEEDNNSEFCLCSSSALLSETVDTSIFVKLPKVRLPLQYWILLLQISLMCRYEYSCSSDSTALLECYNTAYQWSTINRLKMIDR